jgi:Na+-driven multidrug efflux pump
VRRIRIYYKDALTNDYEYNIMQKEDKIMKNLQKAGGICSLIASATYIFAMGLVLTILTPMANTNLGFQEYISFVTVNKTIIYIWNFSMYFINGICLAVLVLALRERLNNGSPQIAKISSVFGFIWTAFVFLSGLIVIFGTESIITLYAKNQNQAEMLKQTIDTITMSIDHSDKLLGSLWVGLVSIAAFRNMVLPKIVNVLGIIISIAGIIGIIIPSLLTISYVFGFGAIIWWLCIGIFMLRKIYV